jgi:hypothetical protein
MLLHAVLVVRYNAGDTGARRNHGVRAHTAWLRAKGGVVLVRRVASLSAVTGYTWAAPYSDRVPDV